ncbi:endonuclease-reverse transcriptase [Plakobranchus ocellatus]|uniref:Endonuclease-reverse transcriptase n=1 Tax=Plakobranchus ocellatus TaxID=259542 RepID=A0AAV3Y1I4_9GAST|nr:endonuclease-reverse transcriptase [Plakobranchus ocellatus]
MAKRCTECQTSSGRRDRGRTEARWMDDIRKAAGPQWQRKAQGRRKWKTSAEGYILQWLDKASKVTNQRNNSRPTNDLIIKSRQSKKIPRFLEEEVKQTLDEMKKKKAPRNDGITRDVMKIGGSQVIQYMTKVYDEVLKSKEILICWKEAKAMIIHKKVNPPKI